MINANKYMEVFSLAYMILDTCTNCGKCIDECPPGAIVQADNKCDVVAADCIDCGACVDVCETDSIVPA